MSRPRLLRTALAASVAVLTAAGVLGVVRMADASHSGTASALSSSNGSPTIRFAGGATLTAAENVTNAAWSPDGSRAAYVGDDGAIVTVRYNDGEDLWVIADPVAGGSRAHPTWSGTGSLITWAERAASNEPWRLHRAASSGSFRPWTITPDDGFHYTHPDEGPNGLLVFQRQANSGGTPTGTPEVWRLDPTTGEVSVVISNASHPAVSPDGARVAFVRSDGTNNQIFTSDLSGANLMQVTSNATAHDNPVWSHNGATIAFNTGTAGAVATAPANGSGAANPTPVAGLTGLPAYQSRNSNQVVRLFGQDRFTTAIASSNALWATAGNPGDERLPAESVVLSRSDTFADALGGAALAAAKQGPLLLTPPTSLNANTKAEISRVLGSNTAATVYLLGSPGAISQAVQNEVAAMGYNVVRLAGSNRFGTSVAIANEIDPTPDLVLAATGLNFPDALAAGTAAGSFDVPGSGLSAVVILTSDNNLSAETRTYLDNVSANPETLIFGVGLQGATATESYGSIPLIGANRYETALLVALSFFDGETIAGVATGANWPDALSGGPLLATLNGPLLLTPATATLSPETAALLDIRSGSISTGVIFGSTAVVNSAINNQIGNWISGPAGFTTGFNATSLGRREASPAQARRLGEAPTVDRTRTAKDIKAAAERAVAGEHER